MKGQIKSKIYDILSLRSYESDDNNPRKNLEKIIGLLFFATSLYKFSEVTAYLQWSHILK